MAGRSAAGQSVAEVVSAAEQSEVGRSVAEERWEAAAPLAGEDLWVMAAQSEVGRSVMEGRWEAAVPLAEVAP
jgi:hypothetical protein